MVGRSLIEGDVHRDRGIEYGDFAEWMYHMISESCLSR